VSDFYLGEIRMVGFNFAPQGWATCDGQLLAIQQNTALFALLGTQYGGNGQTTFALPDLRGRRAVHVGQGPGLSPVVVGEVSGAETVTLTQSQMPTHTHTLQASTTKGTTQVPAAGSLIAHAIDGGGKGALPEIFIPAASSTGSVPLGGMGNAGGSQPFGILDPFLGITHCIALQGIFPSRN